MSDTTAHPPPHPSPAADLSGGWRDAILAEFVPGIARLTVVADPDGLLLEETILQVIRERGFDVVSYEDPIAFRFDYESRYRSHWDRGASTDLALVVRTSSSDLSILPYDLLSSGWRRAFGLGKLFPNLSYPIIAALDPGDLDPLYAAYVQHTPRVSGENATVDFILRFVFKIDSELVRSPPDLLALLLRRHQRPRHVPAIVDARFIQLLRQNHQFDNWPLEQIVPDREAFVAFLQERWPVFLDRLASSGSQVMRESSSTYNLSYPGPADLPFDHPEIRPYVGDMFLDGTLRPVEIVEATALGRQWAAVGVRADPDADLRRRIAGLIDVIENSLPAGDARYQEWTSFAYRWAEVTALWYSGPSPPTELAERRHALRDSIDRRFLAWSEKRYGGLYNQPAIPVMVHHIPRALAQHLAHAESRRVALVVLDGIALDQWVTLRTTVSQQRPNLIFRESGAFAWVPTITTISRQAIFAGRPPSSFPRSMQATDHEPALWAQFWADQGIATAEVTYKILLGDHSDVATVDELVSDARARVLGLVVRKVDKITHGIQLGTAGVHDQVRLWAQTGFLAELLDRLLERDFVVFLTSDHGNIEAVGCGRPSEGAIATSRGERVRVYPTSALRSKVKAQFPETIEWPPLGLPDGFFPLLAPARRAFVPSGEQTVSHGGVSLEEVIVPYVQVMRSAS